MCQDTSRKWRAQNPEYWRRRRESKGRNGTSVIDYVVSADGKTLTVTRKGAGTNTGRTLDEVHVYDKQ